MGNHVKITPPAPGVGSTGVLNRSGVYHRAQRTLGRAHWRIGGALKGKVGMDIHTPRKGHAWGKGNGGSGRPIHRGRIFLARILHSLLLSLLLATVSRAKERCDGTDNPVECVWPDPSSCHSKHKVPRRPTNDSPNARSTFRIVIKTGQQNGEGLFEVERTSCSHDISFLAFNVSTKCSSVGSTVRPGNLRRWVKICRKKQNKETPSFTGMYP